LIVADLLTNESRDLFPDGVTNDGQAATWHPDGRRVAILRQYMDGDLATQGQQVYLYESEAETLVPLIVDNAYNHGSLSFSPDGDFLLVQRFAFGPSRPGIWVYDMATGALTDAVADAYLPKWVPKPK
jgi:dipeptidyl aminopeptidase/acylaminoacyl peptidase